MYSTPSEMGKLTSVTSNSTMTFAALLRLIGGGTSGASVRTAFVDGDGVAAGRIDHRSPRLMR